MVHRQEPVAKPPFLKQPSGVHPRDAEEDRALFWPPEELANDLGNDRSPFVFDDGRPARTQEEWQRRRKEILRFWHEALGSWPPRIERPAIKVLQTENREGFLWRRAPVLSDRRDVSPGQQRDALATKSSLSPSRKQRQQLVGTFHQCSAPIVTSARFVQRVSYEFGSTVLASDLPLSVLGADVEASATSRAILRKHRGMRHFLLPC